MTAFVLATAGHVDHGKSSLILALTGTDPDRWKEEKERGLTIDLGFAHIQLPSGKEISLIDVPGHIRFIKNMLAGVGAIDGALFIVAAIEGWKPQSEEHLRILDLLGTRTGIVVITKSSLVDSDWLELCKLEVTDHLAGTFLQDAPIVPVDSITREGLPLLIDQLESMLESIEPSVDRERPRLWIDRVFSSKGSGTVVTGTLSGGKISLEQEMAIFHSSGKSWLTTAKGKANSFLENIEDTVSNVRVRGLQSHGRKLTVAEPGRRLALNLANISPEKIARGDVLINSWQWSATATFDGSVKVLASISHKFSKKGAYAVYLGSGDFPVKISLIGKEELEPGETGMARIHLESFVPLTQGDRFIIRELGRQETVAGGQIVNVNPTTTLQNASASLQTLEEIVNERGLCETSLIFKMTGNYVAANLGTRYLISDRRRKEIADRLHQKAEAAGEIGFDISELGEPERLVLLEVKDLKVEQTRVLKSGLSDLNSSLAAHPFVAELEKELFSPPAPENIERERLRELVRRNIVIESEGIYFSPKAIDAAKNLIWTLHQQQPEGFTVSELRERLGTSRKYILPLLKYLDSHGLTRRNNDLRVAGPALTREFSSNQ